MTLLTAAAGALLLPIVALAAAKLPAEERPPVSTPSAGARSTTALRDLPAPVEPHLPTSAPIDSSQPTTTSEVRPPPPGRWMWPLWPRPQLAREFLVGPTPWSPGHRGVDLVPAAASKDQIRAPASGVVRFTGVIAGRPVLSIDHGAGLISSFEPVVSTVRPGRPVHRGAVIGHLARGPNHCGPPCLHWGVSQNGHYINPLLLVPAHRSPAVLLPLP